MEGAGMMKRFFVFLVVILLVVSTSLAFSQNFPYNQDDPVLKKIIELGKTDNQTMKWLDYMTNRFGERVVGTDGYNNAAQWAIYEFHSWGVQAELEEVAEVPVGFTRGAAWGKIAVPTEKYLYFTTPAFTAGTKGIQRGSVVVVPADSLQILSMSSKFKGAWALVSDAGNLNRSPRRGEKSFLAKLLEESGALGAIRSSRVPFNAGSSSVSSWDNLPTLPDIILQDTLYNEIKGLAGSGQNVELVFDIHNGFKLGPVKYSNIIAWLPGTDFPNEYVILSGHFDTVGGSTGAVDCGSGCTPAMEALRLIVKAGGKPKRSVMVCLFAAEELGIIGSQAWLKAHPSSVPKIALDINRDYSPGAVIGATVAQSWYEDFVKITTPLINLNPNFPFTLAANNYPGARALRPSGTDASAFSMFGVPTLRMSERTEHVYNSTYHTVWDTYADVVPYAKYQEHTALVLAVVAYGVANLDHLLPRNDVYLADGMYADINTTKGRIIASLDIDNAPETVKSFAKLFEATGGAPAGGQRGPAAAPAAGGGGRGGGGQQARPALGAFNLIDAKAAAQAVITLAANKARADAKLPKEKNILIKHDKAGVLGMISPTKFYLTTDKKPDYDNKYIPIGNVIAGLNIVNTIAKGDSIRSIQITRIGQKATAFGRQ
jgi:cyclophilin family peptidyl-prolyl cis-trans isomerase